MSVTCTVAKKTPVKIQLTQQLQRINIEIKAMLDLTFCFNLQYHKQYQLYQTYFSCGVFFGAFSFPSRFFSFMQLEQHKDLSEKAVPKTDVLKAELVWPRNEETVTHNKLQQMSNSSFKKKPSVSRLLPIHKVQYRCLLPSYHCLLKKEFLTVQLALTNCSPNIDKLRYI